MYEGILAVLFSENRYKTIGQKWPFEWRNMEDRAKAKALRYHLINEIPAKNFLKVRLSDSFLIDFDAREKIKPGEPLLIN